MHKKLIQIQKHRRRGNLLIIVLIGAIIVSMLYGIVRKAATDLSTADAHTKSVVDIYNGLAFADLFADAFFADIRSQYNQEVIEPGTLEFTPEFYQTMISGVDGFAENMHIDIDLDGIGHYTGSAPAVIESITLSDDTNVTMRTQFKRIADRIEQFQVTLENGFEVDDASEKNILNGESGDRYYLNDINFTLEFTLGIEKYYQSYRIVGLYAEFSIGEGIVTCTIKADDADMYLLSQNIG